MTDYLGASPRTPGMYTRQSLLPVRLCCIITDAILPPAPPVKHCVLIVNYAEDRVISVCVNLRKRWCALSLLYQIHDYVIYLEKVAVTS